MPPLDRPDASARPRTPGPRALFLLLAFGLLAAGSYLAVEGFLLSSLSGLPLDDSWIHLQFARNLAHGDGLAYNPGQLVTGSTAPLWTALLSVLFLLPGDVVLWVKLFGILLYLAGGAATWRLARDLGLGPGLAALAGGLTLGTSWLVWSALSGMEIPLFVLLSMGGMVLHLAERAERDARRRPPLSLLVFALSVLARPEGALLLLLAVLDRLLVWRREPSQELALARPPLARLAAGAGLAALALAPTLAFYAWAGGSVLPTTFAAKAGGGGGAWLPSTLYLYKAPLNVFFAAQPVMALTAAAGILVLVERLGSSRDAGLLPALWLLGLPLAYSLLSPTGRGLIAGNFGRYYFPLFPPLIVLGVLGLQRAAAALGRRVRAGRVAIPLGALLLVLALWPTAAGLVVGAARYARNVANIEDGDVRMARWLAPRLPPEATLGVVDIGALKYFLPNRIVDLAGIANPEVRRYVGAALAAGRPADAGFLAFLAAPGARPDYLVLFPDWMPGLTRDAAAFKPLYRLSVADNVTLGGDQVVLYSTPWTRYPLREPPPAAPPAAAPR